MSSDNAKFSIAEDAMHHSALGAEAADTADDLAGLYEEVEEGELAQGRARKMGSGRGGAEGISVRIVAQDSCPGGAEPDRGSTRSGEESITF